MRRLLDGLPEVRQDWPAREIVSADQDGLADLMHVAYRGTPDDEGETLEEAHAEIRRTFDGQYGALIPHASMVCEVDGALRGACMVTHWRGAPLIAFAMTHPDAKRQGVAASLIVRALHALAESGYREVNLAVTDANEPARRLYEALGFARYDGP